MTPLVEAIMAAYRKMGVELVSDSELAAMKKERDALQAEIADLKRIIRGLVKEAHKGIDIKLELLEVSQKVRNLEAKYNARSTWAGVS